MNNSRYLKRLKKDMPEWQKAGWLSENNAKAILDHIASQESSSNLFAYTLAILGVLLLGSGVITYFAANWSEMSKLSKLAVLFGSLYAAYGMGGYLLETNHSPKIGQALILLGVILFGANIMLIAQIYHIEEHYPNGVLFWSLGGLVTAYLLRSQPALIAAMLLGLLWTGMESFVFDEMHYPFLIMWLSFLPAIYLWHWRGAQHVGMITLLFWTVFTWFSIDYSGGRAGYLYLVQLYFVIYLAMFIAGMLMHTSKQLNGFAGPVQNYSVIGALFSLYVLTFPDLQSGLRSFYDESFRLQAGSAWIVSTLIALAVLTVLALWHRQRAYTKEQPRYLLYAQILIGATIALIFTNLFVTGVHGSWIALAFNLLFFGGMVWLVFAGMYMSNRFLINVAFVFFALGLLTRYFDTFWTLLNRSFFFMAGGLILIVGGYLLEQQRRRISTLVKNKSAAP